MHAQGAPRSQREPLSRRTKLIIAVALGSAVLVLAVAPFALMTLPDPHPYRVDSLAGERSGTFVSTGAGYYKLYPYSAPLFSFPSDALVAEGRQPTVYIKARQMSESGLFAIKPYGSDQPVALRMSLIDANTMEMIPEQPLPPGQYVISAPRDSVDQAIDSFYLQIPG